MLCSDYWDLYRPRDDDIVIATAFKAGTTWMQTIVANLIFQDGSFPEPVMQMAPWIDRYRADNGIAEVLAHLERQSHRRFLKTHLPLDALRFIPEVKYIFLSRDARDVFMSLWNHHCNLSEVQFENIARASAEIDVPWPETSKDLHEFWRTWITEAWFPWETEGFPYWSLFHNVNSWWPYRHLPNILFVHYNDLLIDTQGQIQRVAEFLDIGLARQTAAEITARVSLKEMKKNADKVMGVYAKGFKGGGETFINKGTNGRWREVLSESDLELYTAAVERNYDEATARWTERGGDLD